MSSTGSSYDNLSDFESMTCVARFEEVGEMTDPKDLKILEQDEQIRKLTEEMEKLRSKVGEQTNEEILLKRVAELEAELVKAEKETQAHSVEMNKLEKELEQEKRYINDLLDQLSHRSRKMDQMDTEIRMKMEKIKKLQKRIQDAEEEGILEKEVIPDPYSVQQKFMGRWKLQSPSRLPSDIPKILVFSLTPDGKFIEQNNGTLCDRYDCIERPEYARDGFWGNKTYIEGDELMSESYGKQYKQNYTMTRRVKGEKLTVRIDWLGKTECMVYKKDDSSVALSLSEMEFSRCYLWLSSSFEYPYHP